MPEARLHSKSAAILRSTDALALTLALTALTALFACGDETPAPAQEQAGEGETDGEPNEVGSSPNDVSARDSDDAECASEPCANDASADGAPGFLSPVEDGWLSLVEGAWEVPAGTEEYRCVRMTVPEDVYVTQFKPLSPAGTHHTAMGINDPPNGEDGVTACNAAEVPRRFLSASGVGTGATDPLPDGVAFKLKKGDQVLLNLHLFNTGTEPLKGVSGTLVRTIPANEVEHEADALIVGPLKLDIPVGEVTQSSACTVKNPSTIVQIFPHMHQLGVYMNVMAQSSEAGEVELYDGPYGFEEQPFFAVTPVPMAAGDTVSVTCRYNNTTDKPVGFGDSSLDEMCFAYLVRYPAPAQAELVCTK